MRSALPQSGHLLGCPSGVREEIVMFQFHKGSTNFSSRRTLPLTCPAAEVDSLQRSDSMAGRSASAVGSAMNSIYVWNQPPMSAHVVAVRLTQRLHQSSLFNGNAITEYHDAHPDDQQRATPTAQHQPIP